MPWIYLDATTKNNTYHRNANVSESPHDSCKLFKKYIHTPNNRITAEDIAIYKKGPSAWSLGIGSHATISKGTGLYETATVSGAHVYYNIFDIFHKYPLLLFISFSGLNVKSKYYKRSDFDTEIDKNRVKKLDELTDYTSDQKDKLLQSLIEQNDNIPEPLTYDIGKKSSTSNVMKYNGEKIRVVDDTKSVGRLSSHGFKKYKHTPEKNHTTKKSCVMYNNNTLLYWKDPEGDTINEIQGKLLKTVVVFFSNKDENQPLLAGFEIQSNWEYYYYKKYEKGFFWQKIDRGASYHLFGKYTEEDRIQRELIVNQVNLVKILQKVEFTVLNSVVLLVEKTELYRTSEVKNAIKSVSPEMIPNPSTSEVQPEEINVGKQNCTNLQEKNYQCYLHEVIPVGEPDSAELRVLIPTSHGIKKYTEIKLYKNETTSEENRDYLFYKKKLPDSSKLWAYLYGSDPRPLLLCHGGRIYKLKDKDRYFTQWIATHKTEKCECENVSFYTKLLDELTKAVGTLNQVFLCEHPPSCDSGVTKEYNIHQYNGKQIKIRVDCQNVNSESSVGYQSCFRKVSHTPSGMNGTFNGTGFRLGNILYNAKLKQKASITYGTDSTYKHYPLVKVGVYFYNKDTGYKDPLLVELQFRGDGGVEFPKEYYKLNTVDETNMSWTVDTQATGKVTSGSKDLVNYLEQLRYRFKKVVQVQIQKNTKGSYDLKVGQDSDNIEKFTQPKTEINKHISVEEDTSCTSLNKNEYTCYKHKLSDLSLDDIHQEIGGLKITIPKQLPKENTDTSNSYQKISFYNIREGKVSEVKAKIKENNDNLYNKITDMVTEYSPIYYTLCMGDLYVYFKKDDARPLLLCFDGMAYRPLKLPKPDSQSYSYNGNEDYTKWIRAPEITSCACQEDNLISVLKEVESIYDGDNTVAIATSTTVTLGLAGGGTGLAIYKYPDFFLSLLRKVFSKGAA